MVDAKRLLRVFLCHASADKPVVHTLFKSLVDDGADAWIDSEKLLPGQNWQIEIPKAVRETDIVIVCLSKNSVNKEGYVQKEIKLALDAADEKPEGTIFIIPARMDDCGVPYRLSMYQWVDLNASDGYQKLLEALRVRAKGVGAVLSGKEPTRIKSTLDTRQDSQSSRTIVVSNPLEKVNVKDNKVGESSERLVANMEYLLFVESTKHRKPLNWNPVEPYYPDDQNEIPVTAISWDDAVAYCDWAGGCLPNVDDKNLSPKNIVGDSSLSEIGEWRDLGNERQKKVLSPFTSGLIALVDRDNSSVNIGFRCIPVRSAQPTKWALIQGGSYMLGTDLEKFKKLADSYQLDISQRKPILGRQSKLYKVSDYTISVTCVTNEEYFKFTQISGNRWPHHWDARWFARSDRPFPARLKSKPVTNITAEDAQAFCIWSRTRLPKWFEWERASSGKNKMPYPWGANYDAIRNNSKESGRGSLADVDEYPIGDSAEGVRQLCGNIAEWVVDPDGKFEIRGGSYRMDCELWGLAYTFRQVSYNFSAVDVGFRVVHD
jgi:formylglycine-generating enzyme required for sulfatase activity